MKDTIDFFLSLNDYHWQGSGYQWFFYAGILITLIFEKRRMVKIVFGWMPLLFLIFIFNPLSVKLMSLAGVFSSAYYARMFSFMPLMYVIARGMTFLVNIDDAWLKLCGVGLTCVIIFIVGKNIYHESWLVKADNYEKVPQSTLDILNAIKSEADESVRIATIDADAIYIRQIADVVTPYARRIGYLGGLLSADQPDACLIMRTAGLQDVDYVVVRRTDATLASFLKYRYRPLAMTKDYAIYRVEGVSKMRRTFNEKRQVISVDYYDATGRPEGFQTGISSYAYSYDSSGNQTRETRLDHYGRPTSQGALYASIERDYYLCGLVRSIVYLDENDNIVLKDGRYRTRYAYNSAGRMVSERYYDEAGKPMKKLGDLYAARKLTYATSNAIKTERYYDEQGNPIRSAGGYAGLSREYDDELKIVSESYFDTDGSLIGSVSVNGPAQTVFMDRFLQFTEGAKKEGDTITLEMHHPNNPLNAFCFQLYDAVTGEYRLSFGDGNATGQFSGEYVHELPGGIYRLVFKGNTKLQDERVSCLAYIAMGDRLYYSYRVDEMTGNSAKISDFHIGRAPANHN